ncbi:hypothetical protein [Enterovibrio norvegicus]|uniref:hypothetical protein n=1 Tax=Enterovibrio norvegicus TaxID=188144 RepID=UPI00352F5E21
MNNYRFNFVSAIWPVCNISEWENIKWWMRNVAYFNENPVPNPVPKLIATREPILRNSSLAAGKDVFHYVQLSAHPELLLKYADVETEHPIQQIRDIHKRFLVDKDGVVSINKAVLEIPNLPSSATSQVVVRHMYSPDGSLNYSYHVDDDDELRIYVTYCEEEFFYPTITLVVNNTVIDTEIIWGDCDVEFKRAKLSAAHWERIKSLPLWQAYLEQKELWQNQFQPSFIIK